MTRIRVLILVVVAGTLALQTAACKKPHDPANPAEMKEKLSTKVGWALWKVDANDEQEDRFDAMLDELAPVLFGFQEESKAIKRNLTDVLWADAVDPDALGLLQKKMVNLFDRYMKRMNMAAIDAADILTLEQRRELIGMWKEWEFGD